MKKVLVTGGTGFIGSNLAASLVARGCEVRIFRRENSDLRTLRGIAAEHVIGDVRDPASVLRAVEGCDTVFHAAALVTFVRRVRDLQEEVNVSGTRNVVRACLARGVGKLVHTSSIAAIGHPPPGDLATEESPFNWPRVAGYKFSKYQAEQCVLDGVAHGLDAVIVNPTVVIGERDSRFHGGQLVKEAARGRLLFYPDGGMNVAYVGDVVRGHLLAAERGSTGKRYILGGHNMTHKEIFERTARLLRKRPPLARLPAPLVRISGRLVEAVSLAIGIDPPISSDLVAGAGIRNWYSIRRAEDELGYTVSPFDQAILGAYRWYRENGFL